MADGIILGILFFASLCLSFYHLPWRKLKNFFYNHFLIADAISVTITFSALCIISQSLTAVTGAVVAGLLVNIALVTIRKLGHVGIGPLALSENKKPSQTPRHDNIQ